MSFYLYIEQCVSPPRSEVEIMVALRKGLLSPDVLCARAGGKEWKPLRDVFPDAVPAERPVLRLKTPSAPPPLPVTATAPALVSHEHTGQHLTTSPIHETSRIVEPIVEPVTPIRPARVRRSSGRFVFDMIKLGFVAAAGVLTSIILVWILAAIELWTGFSVHGLTVWFVIPVGAVLAGMGAAIGCYYSSRVLHYYPRFLFLLVCVGLAVGSFAYINYLVWLQTKVDGVPLPDLVGYVDYMNYVSHHTEIVTKYNHNKAIELGEGASMAYFLIQILGFMVGGLCVYNKLTTRPYCHESNRYMRILDVFELYERHLDTMDRRMEGIKSLLKQGRHRDVIAQHPFRETLAKRGHTEGARSVITIYKAKKSSQATLRHQVFTCSRKNDWDEIDDLSEDYLVTDF